MRQRHWVELLKDYDCIIEYHPGKANVVADALGQKSSKNLYHIRMTRMPLLIELRKLDVEAEIDSSSGVLATLKVRPILIERIEAAQQMDEEAKRLSKDAKDGKVKELSYNERVLKFEN